jgi:putative PIN family toxin of toxin-antitoxin system
MTVVIDTNVLVSGLNPRHPFSAILDAWVAGRLRWAVSTDVLVEYEEVVTRMLGGHRWQKLTRLIDVMDAGIGNVTRVVTYFQFLAVTGDRDDDKFADCAIAVHADYIITEDRHFRSLANAGYKPQPITPEEFIRLHLTP